MSNTLPAQFLVAGFVAYNFVSSLLFYLYYAKFLNVDEEAFGRWELLSEGFMPALSLFLVSRRRHPPTHCACAFALLCWCCLIGFEGIFASHSLPVACNNNLTNPSAASHSLISSHTTNS